jgi:wyosine [tRNA(Phe)-imidazoG37] synthetase (radical SAM superfamily)
MGELAAADALVYGPVRSRRLGISLGINILPAEGKTCNFDCPYCQYGWTSVSPDAASLWPTPEMIGLALSERLREAKTHDERIDRLTLAGRGEPTLHPQFSEIVTGLRAVRDRQAPGTRLAILSNSSTAEKPAIRAALLALDERYMKLDAGDPITLRYVNDSPISCSRIVEALRTLPDLVIQTMFVSDPAGRMDNCGDISVAPWLRAIARIAPREVYLSTLDRTPASSLIHPVPDARLLEIANRVRRLGLNARTFLSNSVCSL